MSDHAHRYLVAYDIADDTRRTRVAQLLQSYGDRLQYSVFLVDIKPARMVRLRAALATRIEPSGDSVLICDLGPRSGEGRRRLEFIGVERAFTGDGPLIL